MITASYNVIDRKQAVYRTFIPIGVRFGFHIFLFEVAACKVIECAGEGHF